MQAAVALALESVTETCSAGQSNASAKLPAKCFLLDFSMTWEIDSHSSSRAADLELASSITGEPRSSSLRVCSFQRIGDSVSWGRLCQKGCQLEASAYGSNELTAADAGVRLPLL